MGIFKRNHTEKLWNITLLKIKHSNFQGNIWRSSFLVVFCSAYSKTWNFTKRYPSKDLTVQVKCIKNISWYYNKTINWGDTSDFVANIEFFFSAVINFWKTIYRITFKPLRSFQDKYLWWSSFLVKSLCIAQQLCHDSETYHSISFKVGLLPSKKTFYYLLQ